ncbi:hypothetical protein FCM35_KLT17558 [Carex littledalei]|uniref:Uncharacterized protein n=1 Tax=Carex littledalei TaxID=544730 RepID=A0A833RMT3_9POAL|nr:hypothetical protein FCM35_KLT17558 [Carex littledalei]
MENVMSWNGCECSYAICFKITFNIVLVNAIESRKQYLDVLRFLVPCGQLLFISKETIKFNSSIVLSSALLCGKLLRCWPHSTFEMHSILTLVGPIVNGRFYGALQGKLQKNQF